MKLGRNHQRLHDEVQRLLPWLVNDSLAEKETDVVLAHLRECAECREARDQLQRMMAELDEVTPEVQDYRPSFLRLIQRIERDDSQRASPVNAGSTSPRGVFALVASLVVAIGAGVWLSNVPSDDDAFVTLTDPAVLNTDKTNIRLLFSDDIEQSRMRQILVSMNANIISGPEPSGYLVVSVPGVHDTG
ncbi:MAG: zf-HC2 domain-containing protein, partial [Pseudomonadota bacterium]